MDNGKELAFNPETQYKYIGHGYALTDYKSQGQTEKHVIYHADTDKGVNFNQVYVGITRGKDSITIFTNDKAELRELAKEEQHKSTTLNYNLREAKAAHQEKLDAIADRIPNVHEAAIAADKTLGRPDNSEKDKPPVEKINQSPEFKDNRKEIDRGFDR